MEGAHAFTDREAAASLIRWWHDAGVDTLIEDEPRDWLKPAPVLDLARYTASAGIAPLAHPLPQGKRAEELPPTLADLLAWMRSSADVPEAKWGHARILPTGDAQAGLMILTDMPEPGDVEAGMLMAGELGALFDKMLTAIGRDRGSLWLAPMATVRPAGGRVLPDDVQRLTAIARHHIGLITPKRLLIMGELPNRALIGPDWQAARGSLQTLNHDAGTVDVVSTFHPRLLLQRPAHKAQAWKDLQLLMKGL